MQPIHSTVVSGLVIWAGAAAWAVPINTTIAVPPGTAPVISTPQGQLRGVVRHGVIEYRGIPYATAPQRWQVAQPAPAWQGVLEARNFGPACPQQARFGLTEASSDEDCLSINVSRPLSLSSGQRLPVLVWIHGGAFVGGSSNLYRLDALARQNLVVVTPNYRLGVLGFLPFAALNTGASAASNGNLGLLDQREALRWVQRNIAAFGGDPNNVTLGGESAGAGSLCMHLANPEQSQGLFHKGFLVSAGCLMPLPSVQGYSQNVGQKVTQLLNCNQSDANAQLTCLRNQPLAALLAAGNTATEGQTMTFGPSIGATLATPRTMAEAIAQGKVLKVPLLMGGARNELRLYVGYEQQSPDPITAQNYGQRLLRWYAQGAGAALSATAAQQILNQFPLKDPTRAAETVGSVISHYTPKVGINNCLYLHTSNQLRQHIGMPIYQFEFADPEALVFGVGITATPDPKMEFGAVHSAALNYLFPHLSNTSRIDAPDLIPGSIPLAQQMQQMVASFAATGRPRSAGLPPWPVFNSGKNVMRLEPQASATYDAAQFHGCAFWRQLFPQRLS